MADAEAEAARNPSIGQFLFRNADLSQTKQVADIEDLDRPACRRG